MEHGGPLLLYNDMASTERHKVSEQSMQVLSDIPCRKTINNNLELSASILSSKTHRQEFGFQMIVVLIVEKISDYYNGIRITVNYYLLL